MIEFLTEGCSVPIYEVRYVRNYDDVGNSTTVACRISPRLKQYNNYENPSNLAEVVKYKISSCYGTLCHSWGLKTTWNYCHYYGFYFPLLFLYDYMTVVCPLCVYVRCQTTLIKLTLHLESVLWYSSFSMYVHSLSLFLSLVIITCARAVNWYCFCRRLCVWLCVHLHKILKTTDQKSM